MELTHQEVKALWKEHKSDPPGSVFIYKGHEILVEYLKYLHEWVLEKEKK